jgi:gliding motility-associated-like protein
MQMKKLLSIFILAIGGILLFSSPAQASHMAGSDMEFKCLGKDSFKIVLRVYRDCNGIPINATPSINFSTVNCTPSKSASTSMTRTLIRPVRFMCGGQKNICEGGSFPFGMEENRFEVTVGLQQLFPGGLDSNCCWIKVSYQECCRNGSITNIVQGNFYIDALINRCVTPCNSSPQITNYPVAVICNGQPFWFNNGILDTVDYDSISYEMTDPLRGSDQAESFQGSYTKDRPIQFLGFPNNTLPFPAGFHLIPTTGDLGFTSTAIQQPVLAFKISEWRKINGVYQLIGVTRRDVQFFTYQCPPNNPPVLKVNGITTGPFTFTACAGTTLCINITATDKDSAPPLGPDTTKLSWNRGIPQGTFTTTNSPINLVREDEGVFCWTPTDNYVSSLPYYFTVKAEDDNCPVPATATRAIGIRVKARPLGNRTIIPKGCSKFGLDVTITNQDKLTQTPSFQWTVPNVGNGIFNAVNAVTYNTKTVVSHTFPEGGTYVVRLRMEADGCTNFVFDTVQVDSPVKAIAPIDTFACIGGGKTFVGTAKNGKQPYSFRWIYPSAATADTNVISVSPLVTANYILEVKDSFLCLSYDTVQLEIKALPQVNLGPDRRICFKDSVIFDAGDNNGKGLTAFNWITPKGTPDDQIIYGGDSGQYYVMVTDSFMCQKSDSALLFVNREVIADAGPGDSLCIFDATTLRGSGGDTYEWTETISPNVLSNKDTLFLNPQQAGTKDYTLKVSVTYGNVTCYDYDETRVLTHPLPAITFTNKFPKFCITDQWLDPGIKSGMQPVSNTSTGAFTYWTIRDSVKRQCFDLDPNSPNFGMVKLSCLGISGKSGNPPCWELIVVHKDKYGCINTDSICVTIWDLPVVWAGPDTIVCGNDLPVAINPYPNFGVGSEWLSPPSPKTNIPNPVLEYLPLPRKHTFYPARASQDTTYMLVYKATDNNGCENQDTAIYFVKPVPVVNAGVLDDICEDVGVIDLHVKSGATPTGGTWTSEPPIPALNTTTGLFDPKGSGVLYGKFPFNVLRYTFTNAVGCTESDTTKLIVYKLPNTKLTVPDTAVCENRAPFAMNGSPKGPGGLYWINNNQLGPNQSYNTFDPGNTTIVQEGVNKVLFTFKDPQTKCQKNDSTLIRVQKLPQVNIIPPGALCQGLPFTIRGTMAKTSAFRWSTEQKSGTFTGMFNNITDTFATDSVVSYLPGSKDIVNGSFAVILRSTDNGLCPAAYKRQVIKINPQPEGDFTAIQEGCEPFTTLFEGQFTGAEYYRWDFGDSAAVSDQSPTYHISEGGEFSPAHTYKKYGTYPVSVYLRSTDGCDTTITKPDFIKVNRSPIAFFEPDKNKTTVALPRFTFINKSMRSENDGSELIQDEDSVTYAWDFGSPKTDGDTSSAKSPTYTYDAEVGEFMVVLNLVTNKGCASEYSVPVKIEPDITVFAPNAFRPQSGQERNQRFYIEVDGQMTFHLDIFSRWGELVYASDNKDEGWDGKFKSVDCQQDVYAWQVTVTSYNGTIYKYSGTVNLMR